MKSDNELTVATYNIQFGIDRETIVDSIEAMAKKGVDIFCLQEIIHDPSKELIVDTILKRLGKQWQAAYHMGTEPSRHSIGTAILWNTSVVKKEHEEKILLPKLNKFSLHERFYYRLINVPPTPLQRRAISCDFKFNDTQIRVTCVHVDNVGGPKHRRRQIAHLLSMLNMHPKPKYEVLCGDFNTFDLLKTGHERKMLHSVLGSDFIDASEGVGWTSDIYNIDFQDSIKIFPWFIKTFNIHIRSRLDYIWTKNFTILEKKRQNLLGSDHFPIIAKLKIK